jgi:hypothetical protein
MTWTDEELNTFNRLRKEQRERWDEEKERRNNARKGYSESETTYAIGYQKAGDPGWYVAEPFFDPLQLDSGETTDRERALKVAKAIREGTHPTRRGRKIEQIAAVQIVERVAAMTIIEEF